MWDERDIFEHLDGWYAAWAEQYGEDDSAAIVRSLRVQQASADPRKNAAIDDIIDGCDVESIQENAGAWYSDRAQNLLLVRCELGREESVARVSPSIYRRQAQPFVDATRGLLAFVTTCHAAREHVGSLGHADINRIFNGTYGGLDGYVAQEQRIQETYGRALALAGKLDLFVEEDLSYHLFHGELAGQAQAQVYRAVFKDIEDFVPLRWNGYLMLPNNGRPLVVLSSEEADELGR